jgi:thymidylate synthase
MMSYDLFTEIIQIEMGVYLGGYEVFVAQHHLYQTQIGSAFEQMSGE